MSHLSLLTSVLALSLLAGAANALPVQTSHAGLVTLVRGGGGFGGGRGFGGDAGFDRGGGRAIVDDAYRGGRYWGGAGYIGGGALGDGYCGAYAQSDWPRGSCNQF